MSRLPWSAQGTLSSCSASKWVSETLMPGPSLIVTMSGEVEGSGHLHVQHVQAVAPAVDLSKEAPAPIPDPEYSSVDLHQ